MPKHWVSAIFKKFQVRYGSRWISSIEGIEEYAISEWSNVLGGLSAEQVETGLDLCVSDWPPSLPEFKKMCLFKKPMGYEETSRLLFEHNQQIEKEMEESALEYSNRKCIGST